MNKNVIEERMNSEVGKCAAWEKVLSNDQEKVHVAGRGGSRL